MGVNKIGENELTIVPVIGKDDASNKLIVSIKKMYFWIFLQQIVKDDWWMKK